MVHMTSVNVSMDQIKAYKPNVHTQAGRIADEKWRKHDPRIIELHGAGYTSEQTRAKLREETQNEEVTL